MTCGEPFFFPRVNGKMFMTLYLFARKCLKRCQATSRECDVNVDHATSLAVRTFASCKFLSYLNTMSRTHIHKYVTVCNLPPNRQHFRHHSFQSNCDAPTALVWLDTPRAWSWSQGIVGYLVPVSRSVEKRKRQNAVERSRLIGWEEKAQ